MLKIKGADLNDKFNPCTSISNIKHNFPNNITAFILEKHNLKNKVHQFHVYNKNTKQSSFLSNNSNLSNMTKDDTSVIVLPKLLHESIKSVSPIKSFQKKKMIHSVSENRIASINNNNNNNTNSNTKLISKSIQTNRLKNIFPVIKRESKGFQYLPRKLPIRRLFKSRASSNNDSFEKMASPTTFIKNKLISRMLKQISIRKHSIYKIN